MIERVKIALGMIKVWIALRLHVYVIPNNAILRMRDCECDGPIIMNDTTSAEFSRVFWNAPVYPAAITIRTKQK